MEAKKNKCDNCLRTIACVRYSRFKGREMSSIESGQQVFEQDQRTIATLTKSLDRVMLENDRLRAALESCELFFPTLEIWEHYLKGHGVDPETLGAE